MRRPECLEEVLAAIRACRHCRDLSDGKRRLPHEPRPVVRVSATARLAVFGQAPGTRVHASGVPFTDPSGVRLRQWMGVSEAEFYDTTRVAVIPMGFCFPGQDAKGADLPPRPECAPLWRRRLLGQLDRLELVLLAGQYAIAWHLGRDAEGGLTAAVARWREHLALRRPPLYVPLPHPSWRNNAWIARNPWFEAELLPRLRQEVRRVLDLEV